MHEPPLVLLVDDDPQMQDLRRVELSTGGFSVVVASNGAEGLKAAREKKPDLILLDVMMPVMDGAETLLELKADPGLKVIPVLMLTSLADRSDDIRTARDAGAADFLNKDIEPRDLIDKVKSTLRMP